MLVNYHRSLLFPGISISSYPSRIFIFDSRIWSNRILRAAFTYLLQLLFPHEQESEMISSDKILQKTFTSHTYIHTYILASILVIYLQSKYIETSCTKSCAAIKQRNKKGTALLVTTRFANVSFAVNLRCNFCMLSHCHNANRSQGEFASLQTALSNLEEMQHNAMYRGDNRSRSMGVGPMRSRPMEKRHDTSPYSGVPYLSPPPDWRRTNSDSALHQSANEACQSTSAHRRGSNACRCFSFSFFPLFINLFRAIHSGWLWPVTHAFSQWRMLRERPRSFPPVYVAEIACRTLRNTTFRHVRLSTELMSWN